VALSRNLNGTPIKISGLVPFGDRARHGLPCQ